MGQPLRMLIVEDSKDDANLLLHTVRSAGYELVYEVVDTSPAMRAALESQDWDLITSAHAMPHFSAPAAQALAQELRPSVPLIIVSGEIDLNLAVSLSALGSESWKTFLTCGTAHALLSFGELLLNYSTTIIFAAQHQQFVVAEPTIMDQMKLQFLIAEAAEIGADISNI